MNNIGRARPPGGPLPGWSVGFIFCLLSAAGTGCRNAPASEGAVHKEQPAGKTQAEVAPPSPGAKPPVAADEVKKKKSAGEPSWEDTFGGAQDDRARCIRQTAGGGFIIAGTTGSKGAGAQDVWVIRLDGDGNLVWDKTYGGAKTEEAYSIEETADGGFIVAGSTESKGAGLRDGWVIKLKSSGAVAWDRTYGGIFWDELYSIAQLKDGGYITAGYTEPSGAGAQAMLILKLDKKGSVVWSKTYARSQLDGIESITQAKDGSYLAAGGTLSAGKNPSQDAWVIKIQPDGKIAGLKEIAKPACSAGP